MKLAVLGVGLIGGSIGLAARERLDAEVAGFDPDADTGNRAAELGAIDRVATGIGDACRDAEIVFCSAPVGVLPDLLAEALAATGPETAVTDVGSTKREVVARAGSEPRFVGGHPIAGAETSGVDNARADLFEGARWYLTPTERTSGLLYDRVQRAVSSLGARPQAIDPDAHDRVLASVSHLPHVLANVLVGQAAGELSRAEGRLPGVGPSFRDSARVAGANHAIWRDIFISNREAVAAEIDGVIDRLREARDLISSSDGPGVQAWIEEARENRRRLLEQELTGGPVCELRITVPNRPGVVAEIALELGRAGVNIEDMALYPAEDMASGAVTLWIAGTEDADRAQRLLETLDLAVIRIESPG